MPSGSILNIPARLSLQDLQLMFSPLGQTLQVAWLCSTSACLIITDIIVVFVHLI